MLELDPHDGAGFKGRLGPSGTPVGEIAADVFVDQAGDHAAGEVLPHGGSAPGLTACTVMPCPASSQARYRSRDSIAAFAGPIAAQERQLPVRPPGA